MYQSIHDHISVVGIYQMGKFIPKKFKWRNKVLKIAEVTLSSDVKDGGVRKRLYSVMAENNLYRLTFNRDQEVWTLDEVWYE